MDPYEILGIPRTASKDDIRAQYKKLAIANHPDKLHTLDEADRKVKEEYFKRVTVAYHMVMEHHERPLEGKDDARYWKELWDKFSQQDIWGTFVDVATKYIKRRIHKVVLPVTLEEVWTKQRKRVQFFLKGVTEPVRITVDCDRFPYYEFEYEAEDSSYHNIRITMVYKEHDIYHTDEDNQLHTHVTISLAEHISGTTIALPFLDGRDITINIPPFHNLNETIRIGDPDVVVHIELDGICETKWRDIDTLEQSDFLRILEKLV